MMRGLLLVRCTRTVPATCTMHKRGGRLIAMAGTSPRGVTQAAVAQAAADLVAADGLEALSVRQVANRLGVWPTTVVHHAGGRRDGLLPLLIEHLAAGISTELHGDWRARVAGRRHEHPPLAPSPLRPRRLP